LNPPDRIAAAEIEVDLGQAGDQLILIADIFDLDSRFLAAERQQVSFSDQADRSEPVTYLHPLAETGDGNADRKAHRLVGPRAGWLPARLDVRPRAERVLSEDRARQVGRAVRRAAWAGHDEWEVEDAEHGDEAEARHDREGGREQRERNVAECLDVARAVALRRGGALLGACPR